MRTLTLAFCFALLAVAANAQTIAPSEARDHVGKTVTIGGAVSNVHRLSSGMTFIELGGRYPDNVFTAVIFAPDAGKFPGMSALAGKTVEITGKVQLYKSKPEIVLNDASQVKSK